MACLLLVADGNASRLAAQETGNTIGVTYHSPEAFGGYVLFGPSASTNTYLIDHHGRLIQRWTSLYPAGLASYLLDDGHLLRCAQVGTVWAGGSGGRIEEFNWEGDLVWSYSYASSTVRQHHDAIKLPNGNILMVAWESISFAQALAAGRKGSLSSFGVWADHLVEVQPTGGTNGTIVWEWHTWDHLIQDYDPTKANYGVVADHPELVDVNYPDNPFRDWQHSNAVDYNAELDQILLCVHDFGEIWVIDHSTTPAEAAGHTGGRSGKGGDLLYRWGNPQAYRAGSVNDQILFGHHDAQWIPGQNRILIFNNGLDRPGGEYSNIVEIEPPVDAMGNYAGQPGAAYGPAEPAWEYYASPRESFYSRNVSGAKRLPNGNTLICEGAKGVIFEVTDAGSIVWRYLAPVTFDGTLLTQGTSAPAQNLIFRAESYAPDFPGLAGRDLTPLGFLELPATYEFRMVSAERSGSNIRIRFQSEPDEDYQLQFRSDWVSSSWETISAVTAIGTEAVYVDSDATRIELGSGHYRAAREP